MRLNPLARPAWIDKGEDPDYRFTLANERTLLAWLGTSLALLAAAVAVAQVIPPFALAGARTALAVALALLGLAVAGSAYRRWAGNEQAMRLGRPLPYTSALTLLVGGLVAVAVAVAVLVLVALAGA